MDKKTIMLSSCDPDLPKIELYEKKCRYCWNEYNVNSSVCKCSDILCNTCLIEEFKITVGQKDGARCTVCKTQYVAEYKKCTWFLIFASCKDNTIGTSDSSTNVSIAVMYAIIITIGWNIVITYYWIYISNNIDNKHNNLLPMFTFIIDFIMYLPTLFIDIRYGAQWYVNITLIYLIIYTSRNVVLIVSIHQLNIYATILFIAVSLLFNTYLLIYYLYKFKQIYLDHVYKSNNTIIKAKT